jgi:hypothetical protein
VPAIHGQIGKIDLAVDDELVGALDLERLRLVRLPL